MVAVPRLGTAAGVTSIVVLAGLVQGVLEVKTSVIGPPSPSGSKVLPNTPGPDQVPFGNPGSCRPVRLIGAWISQTLVVPSIGVCGTSTVTVVLFGSAQEAAGVKVSVTSPDSPSGLKVLPLTPGPLQIPPG